MASAVETCVLCDNYGYYVEFFRFADPDDDDTAETARWYGTREECEEIAKGPLPAGLQWSRPEWRPDPVYAAGYAYAAGDRE